MTEPARFDALRTDRLVMRRWLESDRVPFAALSADPQTMRFFPQPLDRAASDALVDRIETWFDQLGYGLWALELARTGEFIGFTGINPMPDDVPGAGGTEIGWRLARHAWHHGYATEAARAALTVAFDGVGVRRYLAGNFLAEADIECWFGPAVVSDGRAAVEWWASWTEQGQELTYAGVSVLGFDDQGQVVEHRDYDHHIERRQRPYAGW